MYNTRDGTGERDYIHVVDLADGHILSLINGIINKKSYKSEYYNGKTYNVLIVNLGTGNDTAV